MSEPIIINGWVCIEVGKCTCGAGEYPWPGHEPQCGLEPLHRVDQPCAGCEAH